MTPRDRLVRFAILTGIVLLATAARIVVTACGFGLSRTDTEMDVLRNDRRWSTLRAVEAGHVCLTDGNHFFNRPGPRLSASLDILAEILHPDLFHAAFDRSRRGTAWRQDRTVGPSQTHQPLDLHDN